MIYKLTSYLQTVDASKQLIAAIENNDVQAAQNIIEQYPKCINTLPTSSTWLDQVTAEMPEVYYPLQKACTWGNFDIVKLLVDNGADCNIAWKGIESSRTPLMNAVRSGNEERKKDIINLLLEHGADKSIKDAHGKTAYDYAVEKGYLELAELLKP